MDNAADTILQNKSIHEKKRLTKEFRRFDFDKNLYQFTD
jgi:hypothetical protein